MNAIIECIITEVWTDRGKFTVVSTYNFCITLEEDYFVEITDKMWVEDLNAHNELLGSKKKDRNGIVGIYRQTWLFQVTDNQHGLGQINQYHHLLTLHLYQLIGIS